MHTEPYAPTAGSSGASPALAIAFRPQYARHAFRPNKHRQTSNSHSAFCCQCTAVIGNTPFGRGLLSAQDVPNKQQLCSVPFEQLLLLPEKPGGAFDSVYSKFAKEHQYMPEELLRFVQGRRLVDMHSFS